MLKKLYDKSKIGFSILWIVAYCVLMSLGDFVSQIVGIEKSITFVIGLALTLTLLLFIKKNKLFKDYGFCPPSASCKSMLYYLPLLVMLSANLWYGVSMNYTIPETVIYILTMLCVGFLEETIFRGLLFEAIKKDSQKIAIIVSSVTFGIGHIINLINGSGAELLPNLLQVIYATSAGFMFVMIYCKSKSIFTCIISHGLFNSLSAFSNETSLTTKNQIISSILLILITSAYAIYLAFAIKKEN